MLIYNYNIGCYFRYLTLFKIFIFSVFLCVWNCMLGIGSSSLEKVETSPLSELLRIENYLKLEKRQWVI